MYQRLSVSAPTFGPPFISPATSVPTTGVVPAMLRANDGGPVAHLVPRQQVAGQAEADDDREQLAIPLSHVSSRGAL